MKKSFLLMLTLATLALLHTSCQQSFNLQDECQYSPSKTSFQFWSPVAQQFELAIYNSADGEPTQIHQLKPAGNNLWKITIKGDLCGKYYTVRSFQDGQWSQPSTGIFAKAVSVNGQRAAIVNLQQTNPEGWDNDRKPDMTDPTDIVIYETHLRDFTMSANSGISNKGKFLALTEQGTTTPDNLPSGIDHLKELGITHLQILPMFDYGSIDETHLDRNNYNWGYDPVNYNVPEGGYSTNPCDPATRIKEAKLMIQALHNAGIRVVMDVVYNHTYNVAGCALGQVVPQYFYRLNPDGTYANGSGCGNETASDQPMMRQFMIQSLCYWAKEYHIDGFRFDLMGIHDQETMRQIRSALDQIDSTILTYGEGWAAMAPAIDYDLLAMKQFTHQMPRVGAFSDDIRNALIGSPFDHLPGFASGNTTPNKTAVCFGLIAATNYNNNLFGTCWAGEPMQHISYITCHDNYCLRDRIFVSNPNATTQQQLRINKLAQTAVLCSQGMSFIYGGEELFRTKQGIDNSYQSPDSINIIPWENKADYADLYHYYQQIIRIRHQHKGLRLGSTQLINQHVSFPDTQTDDLINYTIADLEGIDSASTIIVLLNGSTDLTHIADIPLGDYTILAENGVADADGIRDIYAAQIEVQPSSAVILIQK